MSQVRDPGPADVCLMLEGTYPFVPGGVSSWVHDLIRSQPQLRFRIVALVADDAPRRPRFTLPTNVCGLDVLALQRAEAGVAHGQSVDRLVTRIEAPLSRLFHRGGRDDFAAVVAALRDEPAAASLAALMNSHAAFEMVRRMYEASVPSTGFLDYFWTWRSLAGGLFSTLLAPLPQARLYHAISTGYAGLLMARATLDTGRPGLLTEHGIYTNERRVEIAMAPWLGAGAERTFDPRKPSRDLRDVWIDAFIGYSRACYESAQRIVTLYGENQRLQLRDGAPAERLQIIANGVDYDGFAAIAREPGPRRPTVALIGRVVPIKDVKTFIRAVALLRVAVPDLRALVLGPTDEDPGYHRECLDMANHLGLAGCLEFPGRVRLQDHLGQIDAIALTSLSEAQPLVLLEAGAAGVPSVVTDVGSCRELILGRPDESPALGPGGFVTPLADPAATARALGDLLRDPALRERCGRAMQRRTQRYYNRHVAEAAYRDLYGALLDQVNVGTEA